MILAVVPVVRHQLCSNDDLCCRCWYNICIWVIFCKKKRPNDMSPRFKDRSEINVNDTINIKSIILVTNSQWILKSTSNLHYCKSIKPSTCSINVFVKY